MQFFGIFSLYYWRFFLFFTSLVDVFCEVFVFCSFQETVDVFLEVFVFWGLKKDKLYLIWNPTPTRPFSNLSFAQSPTPIPNYPFQISISSIYWFNQEQLYMWVKTNMWVIWVKRSLCAPNSFFPIFKNALIDEKLLGPSF